MSISIKTLFALFLSGLSGFWLQAQAPIHEYSVLLISREVITSDGKIDSRRWEKWDFPHPEHLSIGKGMARQEYLPVGDLYFSLIGPNDHVNAVNEELTRRFEQAKVKGDLTLVERCVHYKGRKLKYPDRVIEGPAMWGSTLWNDGPGGFRFRDYLIFMVQVRPFSEEDPFDFVLYDLSKDTYATRKTFGAWPMVWMFRREEALSDPRLKSNSALSQGLTLRSTRTPPALSFALSLLHASSAPLSPSVQAGPVTFLR